MDSLIADLLQSAVFLGLFYGIYWLFLRKETFFTLNRIYLLAAGCLSLLLPVLRVPSPIIRNVLAAPGAGIPPDAGAGSAPEASRMSLLAVVYLAGAAFFLALFLVRLARLALAARHCDCRPQRGLKVVLCPGWTEPFSFFRTVFLDGSRAAGDDLERILAHEMAHVRQVHSLDVILAELMAVVQWFNPFVWPYKYSLRETHEYLADRAVIAQGCSRTGYQLLILEQHVGGKGLALASRFRTSQIKRRLMMMSRHESKGWSRVKLLLALPAALVLVLAFAEPRTVVETGPQEAVAAQSGAETKAPEPTDEEVLASLKMKQEKLEVMKKDQALKIEELKKAYQETQDPGEREKIMALLKEHKAASHELEKKARSLQMKKLELALKTESDPAKAELLKAKLEDMKKGLELEAKDKKAQMEAKEKEKAAKEKKID